MSKDDETYCRTAVQNYNRLKPVVLEGDMYRLVSPYGSNHTSTMYVGKDKDKAAVLLSIFILVMRKKYCRCVCRGLMQTKCIV